MKKKKGEQNEYKIKKLMKVSDIPEKMDSAQFDNLLIHGKILTEIYNKLYESDIKHFEEVERR